MIKIIRTDSANHDFIELVKHLDADLAKRDGSDHAFYAQLNKVDKIKYVVLAYEDDKAIGCGAIREYGQQIMEIKLREILWNRKQCMFRKRIEI